LRCAGSCAAGVLSRHGGLAERGIEVDYVTVYRWVQTFTSEFIDAARQARHAAGDRWFVDEVRHEAPWIQW
jgi:transposase-like protein